MDLLEAYEKRRSVNFFEKGKEIPQDVLEILQYFKKPRPNQQIIATLYRLPPAPIAPGSHKPRQRHQQHQPMMRHTGSSSPLQSKHQPRRSRTSQHRHRASQQHPLGQPAQQNPHSKNSRNSRARKFRHNYLFLKKQAPNCCTPTLP